MEFEKLRTIIAQALKLQESEITMETAFVEDLGMDSLTLFGVLLEVEKEFNIEIPEETLKQLACVGDAVDYIRSIA